MLQALLDFIQKLSDRVPLEIFAFFGAFIEEVIAPIPSPFVMTLAGSITEAQGRPFAYLFVVAVIAALGKTLGAALLYWLSDKVEDVVMSRLGKFVGITHEEVTKFGQRLSHKNREFASLLVVRMTPVIPSAPISLLCGFLKVPFKPFMVATFFGTIVRDFVYLYFGYTSLNAAADVSDGIENTQSVITILLALAGAAVVVWIIYKRKFADNRE